MNMRDPAVRKTVARLRAVYRDMKREDRLLVNGRAYVNSASTDLRKTFARYDFVAPSELKEMS